MKPSHLLEGGHVSALGREDSSRGVVGAHLVLRLHDGAGGEAQLEQATVHVSSGSKRQNSESSEPETKVSAFPRLYSKC